MKPKRTKAEFKARVREIQRAIKEGQPPPHREPPERYRKLSRKKLTPEEETEATEAGKKLGWTAKHALRYAAALTRWTAAGRPTRTDEEVAVIVKLCEDCKHYKSDEKRCKICGCKINTSMLPIINKSRMGNTHCDKKKW